MYNAYLKALADSDVILWRNYMILCSALLLSLRGIIIAVGHEMAAISGI